MILKELDPLVIKDKYDKAGRNAELQMAHYLLRFFGKSDTFDVLNGIRIEHDGEIAQMDHIVIHPFGLIIVESKSVAGSVQIKDDGQWMRWSPKHNKPFGMRSPVTQAQMQCALLKELLVARVKNKSAFDQVFFDVMVAISDGGTIQWPSSGPLAAVCKADQIPAKIQRVLDIAKANSGNLPGPFNAENRKRMGDFLRAVHQPVPQPEVEPEPATPGGPTPIAMSEATTNGEKLPPKACKHCSATNLELSYGKFGYYFQCRSCQRNTPLRFDCPECGEEGKIRKSGKQFFAECRSCTASAPFFLNS